MIGIQGYIHITFETMQAKDCKGNIKAQLYLSEEGKVQTAEKAPGSIWNEVFMFEVPKTEDPRLIVECWEG